MSLEEKLQSWIARESDGLCEGRMSQIPSISALSRLTKGKNKRIWEYFIDCVKSRQSVENIRNILRLKQAKSDFLLNYPSNNKSDVSALKQEIVNSQEKVLFVRNSLESIRSRIFSSKDSVRKLKEEACILNQKCTFLELVSLSLQEKNKALKTYLEQFYLLNCMLQTEKATFEKFHFKESCNVSHFNKSGSETNDAKIKNALCQILSAIENKVINSNLETLTFNSNKSMSELTYNVSLNAIISNLKEFTKQFENSLKLEDNNDLTSRSVKEMMLSDEFVQKLKFDYISSYFSKMRITNDITNLPLLDQEHLENQIISQKLKSSQLQEFLSVKAENESLVESIKFLQGVLADTINKTKYLVDKNNEQKVHCEQLKPVMQEFYKKLETVLLFLDVNQKSFSDIKKALFASNEYMLTILDVDVKPNHIKFLSYAKDIMRSDFEMSIKLMEKKDFFHLLLEEVNSEMSKVPETTWKYLNMPAYQNRHLICERLIHLKKELNRKDVIFKEEITNNTEEKYYAMLKQLQNLISHSKATEKEYVEKIKESRKCLKVVLDEWQEQKAQFIPVINYEGKSLKMWLDILFSLDDF